MYDVKTNCTKIAKYARIDEGINDLRQIPPNVTHLQCTQMGEKIQAENGEIELVQFDSSNDPFPKSTQRRPL